MEFKVNEIAIADRIIHGTFGEVEWSFEFDDMANLSDPSYYKNDEAYTMANHTEKELKQLVTDHLKQSDEFHEVIRRNERDEDDYIQYCKEEERMGN